MASGKGGKGKKGKNSAGGGEMKSMGDAMNEPGAADPVDKLQEAATGGDPVGVSDTGDKGPSLAGPTRALGDASQAPGDAKPAEPDSAALPEAAQKVDQVLSDATNGQHRRDPGIDAILEILQKAFPTQLPKEAAKEAPAGGMSNAERGALEERANNASKERDDAHSVSVSHFKGVLY